MIRSHFLELLQCPACRLAGREGELRLSVTRRPELLCLSCEESYRIIDGIADMVPRLGPQRVKAYRTETLNNLIASSYDFSLPLMSLSAWKCDPLRFVDWTHFALGRAQGGFHLSLPVATGGLLAHVWAPHHNAKVVAVDLSWNMLRQAKRRLSKLDMELLMVRADVDRLPFREGVFRSILSLNGLHGFDERVRGLDEFYRVLDSDGMLAGSTLIRGRGRIADWVLDFYERNGVSPMLRSREYVFSELNRQPDVRVLHQTHGAVLFFSVERGQSTVTQPSQWIL
ncbi:MAG: methyltransferase domain-containing protein [Myxococcota bacterium]|jgi:ubiquinone/menaquinone biosynthesis C-methylase UbiE/uncharacterized protein YbaR (Trm112 family)|nr:methyltransferase domain-containing protein [Myxococcota bacterium]